MNAKVQATESSIERDAKKSRCKQPEQRRDRVPAPGAGCTYARWPAQDADLVQIARSVVHLTIDQLLALLGEQREAFVLARTIWHGRQSRLSRLCDSWCQHRLHASFTRSSVSSNTYHSLKYSSVCTLRICHSISCVDNIYPQQDNKKNQKIKIKNGLT